VSKTFLSIVQVAEVTGLGETEIISWVEREWISPAEKEVFDDEDISRIRLILDLQTHMGVNEEGISVILHLIDQIYYLRSNLD
jgi:chaperone modulatory protein CbpM